MEALSNGEKGDRGEKNVNGVIDDRMNIALVITEPYFGQKGS